MDKRNSGVIKRLGPHQKAKYNVAQHGASPKAARRPRWCIVLSCRPRSGAEQQRAALPKWCRPPPPTSPRYKTVAPPNKNANQQEF
eukprot:12400876-Karenia_brevis.AAC.1